MSLAQPQERDIDIVFDGPPGPEAGRFVEVEDGHGRSINVGEWMQRPDGLWALRLRAQPSPREVALEKALQDVRQELWVDYCLHMGRTDTDPRPFNSKPHIRIIDDALSQDGRKGSR